VATALIALLGTTEIAAADVGGWSKPRLIGPQRMTASQNLAWHSTGMAVNRRGATLVAWLVSGRGVMTAVRDAGGSFAAPSAIDPRFAVGTSRPAVAVDVHGAMTVAWVDQSTADDPARVLMAHRPPGGSFGPAQQISASPTSVSMATPRIGITRSGTLVIAWAWFNEGGAAGVDAWVRGSDGSVHGPMRVASGPTARLRILRGGEQLVWTRTFRCRGRASVARLAPGGTGFSRPRRFPFAFDFAASNARGQVVAATYDEDCDPSPTGFAPAVRLHVLSRSGRSRTQIVYRHGHYANESLGIAAGGQAIVAWLGREGRLLFSLRRAGKRFSRPTRVTGRCSAIAAGWRVAMDQRGNALLLGSSRSFGGALVTAVKPRRRARFTVPLRLPGPLANRQVIGEPIIRFDGSGTATAVWHVSNTGIAMARLSPDGRQALVRRSRGRRCPGSR
jgi:hypothetical protein